MNIIEKIWTLKSKIQDIRSYISSTLCSNPVEEYKKIVKYELEILELRKQIENNNECSRSFEK